MIIEYLEKGLPTEHQRTDLEMGAVTKEQIIAEESAQ